MEPDPLRRKLIRGIVIEWVLTFLAVTVGLALGGRPDPPALRAAATLLDGPWRFHTGDDAQLGRRRLGRQIIAS